MASSTGTYCDICQIRHISKTAEEYCPVCEEALCTDCNDHHKLSKATKNHQIISIDEYNRLPLFIREIKHYCDEHGDRFEFFCPVHNELCCKRCITTTHSECKGHQVIEDFVDKYSKSSAAIDEYEQTLKDVGENIQAAIADRQNNVEEFEKQTQAVTTQIKKKRKKINKHFDKLQAAILNELPTVEGEKKQIVQSVIEKLQEYKNNNLQLRKDVDAMKKYGSNIQVFMGTIKLQRPVSSQEKLVRSLRDDGSLRFVKLECSISEELNSIRTGIRSFGTLKSTSSDTRAQFNWKSDKAAQILTTPIDMNSIKNISTKLICKIDVSSPFTITSCFVGKCLLFSTRDKLESVGNILQFDSEGKYLKTANLPNSHAFDIALIDLDTVAVTGGGSHFNVYIADVGKLQVKRIINLERGNRLYGATYNNEAIIGCTHANTILSFNIANGKVMSPLVLPLNTNYTANTYLASDNNHLYYSDFRKKSVTCYECKGKMIWSFKNDILQEPRSICLDSNSNVYVAGSESDNVVLFSSDGLHSKELLGPEDGIERPHAIHYDKSSKRLLVVNEKGPAFLYQTV